MKRMMTTVLVSGNIDSTCRPGWQEWWQRHLSVGILMAMLEWWQWHVLAWPVIILMTAINAMAVLIIFELQVFVGWAIGILTLVLMMICKCTVVVVDWPWPQDQELMKRRRWRRIMNMMMLQTNLNLKTKNFPADPRFSIVTLSHLVLKRLIFKVFSTFWRFEVLFSGLVALPKIMIIAHNWDLGVKEPSRETPPGSFQPPFLSTWLVSHLIVHWTPETPDKCGQI